MDAKTIDTALELYGQHKRLEALRHLYPSPAVSYKGAPERYFPFLHLCDAMLFASSADLATAMTHLRQGSTLPTQLRAVLEEDYLAFLSFQAIIQREEAPPITLSPYSEQLRNLLLFKETALSSYSSTPSEPFLKTIQEFAQAHHLFSLSQPLLFKAWNQPKAPLIPLSYTYKQDLPLKEAPTVIFVEAYTLPWKQLLAHAERHPLLLVFPSLETFSSLLVQPGFASLLYHNNCRVYSLAHHPLKQIQAQQKLSFSSNFHCIHLDNHAPLIHHTQELALALTQQFHGYPYKPSIELDRLYSLGLQLSRQHKEARYSLRHYISLQRIHDNIDRIDPNRPVYTAHLPPQCTLSDFLSAYAPKTPKPTVAPKEKPHIAHIVPQIVDSIRHAPSHLLTSLLCDNKNVTTSIYTTEYFHYRTAEYPYDDILYNGPRSAPPSMMRSGAIQGICQKLGIALHFAPVQLDYLQTAHRIAYLLKKHQVDCAIFHEVDPINQAIARMAEVPCSLAYYHGLLPETDVFDGVILHREEEIAWQKEHLAAIQTKALSVPLEVHVAKAWEPKPTPRYNLPVPLDAFLLTTVSGHLASRLSWPMRKAIVKILQQCPHAYYLPMGTPPEMGKGEFFDAPEEVLNRIVFLGDTRPTAQLMRSMDLYLNDFPVGGGLALIEAMAAKLPIVTTFDEKGLPPARNGGHFLGREYCIEGLDWESYAQKAIELIHNTELRKSYSAHSFARYQTMNDPARYARNFQKTVLHFLHNMKTEKGKSLTEDARRQLT